MLEPKLVRLLRRMQITPEKLRQRRSSGPGAHLSKGLGQSMDFSEYRPYQPGDDLRSLDWKVFGRTDRLYTKLYVPEQEETVHFLLDTSASMENKWDCLKTLVLGLANVALGQGDRVAVTGLDNQQLADRRGVQPARGRSALARVSAFLDKVQPLGVTALDHAFEKASQYLKTRCHLIVLSDFLQPGGGLAGLSKLLFRRHRLTLIQLLSPEELKPRLTMSPGEWELFDPEPDQGEAESVRLDIGNQSFSRYQDVLAEHNREIEEFSRRAGAIYVLADSSRETIRFFSEDLRRVGLLA